MKTSEAFAIIEKGKIYTNYGEYKRRIGMSEMLEIITYRYGNDDFIKVIKELAKTKEAYVDCDTFLTLTK